jgi:cell pole-organizing protein PopZ
MGDISAEPSMEDILSSIKRIIAEEGDAAVAGRNARRAAVPRQPLPIPRADVNDFARDGVLELSDPVRTALPEPTPPIPPAPPTARVEPVAAEPAPPESPSPADPVQIASPAEPVAAPAGSILSPQATQATRGPLEALSRMVVKPENGGSDTLEGLVREMLRPMLREWLDAKLPGMVEQMVAKEIARITGQQ